MSGKKLIKLYRKESYKGSHACPHYLKDYPRELLCNIYDDVNKNENRYQRARNCCKGRWGEGHYRDQLNLKTDVEGHWHPYAEACKYSQHCQGILDKQLHKPLSKRAKRKIPRKNLLDAFKGDAARFGIRLTRTVKGKRVYKSSKLLLQQIKNAKKRSRRRSYTKKSKFGQLKIREDYKPVKSLKIPAWTIHTPSTTAYLDTCRKIISGKLCLGLNVTIKNKVNCVCFGEDFGSKTSIFSYRVSCTDQSCSKVFIKTLFIKDATIPETVDKERLKFLISKQKNAKSPSTEAMWERQIQGLKNCTKNNLIEFIKAEWGDAFTVKQQKEKYEKLLRDIKWEWGPGSQTLSAPGKKMHTIDEEAFFTEVYNLKEASKIDIKIPMNEDYFVDFTKGWEHHYNKKSSLAPKFLGADTVDVSSNKVGDENNKKLLEIFKHNKVLLHLYKQFRTTNKKGLGGVSRKINCADGLEMIQKVGFIIQEQVTMSITLHDYFMRGYMRHAEGVSDPDITLEQRKTAQKLVCLVIDQMHKQCVFHNDLHMNNILLTIDEHYNITGIKVIDYGQSEIGKNCSEKRYPERVQNDVCNDPGYTPEEKALLNKMMKS